VLVGINWKYIIAIWLQRNEEQQGATASEKTQRIKRKLIRKIQSIQRKNQKMPHRQWILINAPDNTLQGVTEDQLEAYLYGAQL
jgi:hypothetical protein